VDAFRSLFREIRRANKAREMEMEVGSGDEDDREKEDGMNEDE
jgi:hypothetical protein